MTCRAKLLRLPKNNECSLQFSVLHASLLYDWDVHGNVELEARQGDSDISPGEVPAPAFWSLVHA